jgi:hypothetical protein
MTYRSVILLVAWLAIPSPSLLIAANFHLVPPENDKVLMLDRRVVVRSVNAQLVPGTPVKEPRNPLFPADKPWENSMNNLYPNLLWDEEEQIFKLWYKCVLADPEAIAKMDNPSTVHDVGWYLLYATSKDGLTWDKPVLDLHRYDGKSETNIVARDTPNVGVFKDLHDPDSGRRYKMVYDTGLGQLRARFSADGIHWGEPQAMLGFGPRNGDTHNNAFWDERTDRYLWFTKLYLGERLVARFESTDFLHWKDNGVVLRSSLSEGRTSQTYCLPVFRYANLYLGYAMIYHPGIDRTVDCELAWSPDGVEWERVFPGRPFLPRGPKGSYDSECIYAMSGPAMAEDNSLLLFYGGDDFPHTGWKRHCLPCLARLPLDHFGGYQPQDTSQPATLDTQPFALRPEGLRVTADAAGGSLVIQALDEQGVVNAESVPITTAGPNIPVAWSKGAPSGITRFRVALNRATLYAMSGVELTQTSLPIPTVRQFPVGPVAKRQIRFDAGTEGWKGVDTLVHSASGGFVTASREGRNLPIASSPSSPDSPFAGDWPAIFGGRQAKISCNVRAPKSGGRVQLEIFAADVAQWGFETATPFGPEWSQVSVVLRYDWTDAEAKAAGWRPSPAAFSWAETLARVGKIVVVPAAAGAQASFDLDEVEVTGLAE